MTPDQWTRIQSILEDALQRPPHERDALVEARCADDPELATEVRALLGSADDLDDFLSEPVATVSAAAPARTNQRI